METPKVEISQSEWEVMRIIWTLGPLKSSTIAVILADKMAWKIATTKTFLGRLVKRVRWSPKSKGANFYIMQQLVSKPQWMQPLRSYLVIFVK